MTTHLIPTEARCLEPEREVYDSLLCSLDYDPDERDRLQGLTPFHVIRTVAWLYRTGGSAAAYEAVRVIADTVMGE